MSQWYWCLEHARPEPESEACPQDKRLGPYDTEQDARNWKQLHEQREERWEEQDEEWASWGEGSTAEGDAEDT